MKQGAPPPGLCSHRLPRGLELDGRLRMGPGRVLNGEANSQAVGEVDNRVEEGVEDRSDQEGQDQ